MCVYCIGIRTVSVAFLGGTCVLCCGRDLMRHQNLRLSARIGFFANALNRIPKMFNYITCSSF